MKKHPLAAWRSPLASLLLGLTWLPVAPAQQSEQVTPIIERGDEWRYLDTGVVPPAIGGVNSWKAETYNAAAAGSPWKVGNGLFGYGDNINYGKTLNAGTPNKFATHYFWKNFQIPATAVFGTNAAATYSGFLIRVVRDDAVAIYINGTEIQLPGPTRDNLPTGSITNTTLAINPIEGQSETSTVDFISLTSLKPFPAFNTIAVELHQGSLTTSDARFDLSLDLITEEPCYGDSRAGAFADFSDSGQSIGVTDLVHEREPLEEPFPPDYSFDSQDTELNWRTTSSGESGRFFAPTTIDYVSQGELPNQALGFFGTTSPLTWNSEIIDLRSFKNVVVSADILSVKLNTGTWANNDRLEFRLLVSGDGLTYRTLDWTRISSTASTGNPTAWTDLVGEAAPRKAIVPTAANNPLNTGASNWRTAAFDDAAWPSGNKGAGYENNAGDATNYTDLIDSSLDFKANLFDANPKKSVVYMRCVFPAVPDRATFNALRLLMKYDDGFVAYLNDVEVARKNVAQTSVPTVPTAALPTPTSLASQGNPDTNAVIFEEFLINARLSLINTNAPNVLAIYSLNDQVASSDMVALPVLQIGKPGGPPPISLNTTSPVLEDPVRNFTEDDFTTIDSSTSGLGGSNLIPEGTQSMRIRVIGTLSAIENKAFYIDNIKVRGTPVVPDSFDNYMGVVAPAAAPEQLVATADLDGDAIPNMHEYAFGTDPTVPGLFTQVGGETKPILPVVTSNNGRAQMSFRLVGGNFSGDAGTGYIINDLNVRPQISFGGFQDGDWKDETNSIGYFEQLTQGGVVENGDGSVTITVRTKEQELLDNPNVFVRLRVGARYPSYLSGIDTPCYTP